MLHIRSSLCWNVMQHRLVVTEVLGHPVGPIFKEQAVRRIKGHAVQEERIFVSDFSSWPAWPSKMVPTGCPETLVTINLCRVTSQKSKDLICTAAEAWSLACYRLVFGDETGTKWIFCLQFSSDKILRMKQYLFVLVTVPILLEAVLLWCWMALVLPVCRVVKLLMVLIKLASYSKDYS